MLKKLVKTGGKTNIYDFGNEVVPYFYENMLVRACQVPRRTLKIPYTTDSPDFNNSNEITEG